MIDSYLLQSDITVNPPIPDWTSSTLVRMSVVAAMLELERSLELVFVILSRPDEFYMNN